MCLFCFRCILFLDLIMKLYFLYFQCLGVLGGPWCVLQMSSERSVALGASSASLYKGLPYPQLLVCHTDNFLLHADVLFWARERELSGAFPSAFHMDHLLQIIPAKPKNTCL